VEETEVLREVTIAGLMMRLRLDRIDRLENGMQLIVDYKSSAIAPKVWADERPEDVQLPLYATYAVSGDLGGLVFAQVRPSQMKFQGRVYDAASTLFSWLSKSSGLVKNPLTPDQMESWRTMIERLGEDFVRGVAAVDPREAGKPCKDCHLQAVCRIYENESLLAALDEDGEDSADTEAGASDA
jgi:RecB family exonuclease